MSTKDMNKWQGIGRLTKDPELRYTPSGVAVCAFSIANNNVYKTANGEKKETVSFFNCVAWKGMAEAIAQYLLKGHRISIEGRLQQRTWTDQQGNNRSTVEIIVNDMQFLQPMNNGNNASSAVPPAGNPVASGQQVPNNSIDNPFSDNDIPF